MSTVEFSSIKLSDIFLGDTMFKLKPSHFLAPSKNHFENLWSIELSEMWHLLRICSDAILKILGFSFPFKWDLAPNISLLWKCFSHWFFQYKRVSKDEWYLLLLLIASWRLFSGRKLCSIHQEFVCLYIYCGYKWGCME